jgi:hypothetical protein
VTPHPVQEYLASVLVAGKLRDAKLVGALVILLGAAAASAHHSFAAEFDASRTVTLRGTIVTMEWVNPHSVLSMDVVDSGRRVERWTIELGPPNALFRLGFRTARLLAGQSIIVTAYPSKDGRKVASAEAVTWPDGTHLAVRP